MSASCSASCWSWRSAPDAVVDVRQRAGHARRAAVGVADRQAAAERPAPRCRRRGACGARTAGAASGRRGGRRSRRAARPTSSSCTRSNQTAAVLLARALGMAEHRVPARREVDPAAGQVPVPQAVVGGAHRERVALLAAAKVVERLLVADRVADRALERERVELLLDEVVGDAERGRLEVDLVVALAGEDQHGRARARGERLAHEVEAGAGAEPVVDQVDVVALLARCVASATS